MSNQRNGDQREALFNAIAAYASNNIDNPPALLPAENRPETHQLPDQTGAVQHRWQPSLATLDEMFSPGQEVLDAQSYGVLANVFIGRSRDQQNASKTGG